MNSEKRYELKFVLDEGRLSNALQWMYQVTLAKKVYEPRWVNTLYFDDVNFSSVRDNLTGISQRRKIRLRWYHDTDVNQISPPVFEVKQRESRLGTKIRYGLPTLQASLFNLSVSEIAMHVEEQLAKTAATSTLFDDHLVPMMHVCYRREYFESLDGLRITFDSAIEFSITPPHMPLRNTVPAAYPRVIMELKFPVEMKDQVSRLLRPLSLVAKRHSKYLTGLATFGIASYV